MDILPAEIVLSIARHCIAVHYDDKNALLQLRTVCRLFDDVIKPYVLRTLQLEFTRLDKTARRLRPPDHAALQRIGGLCRALYIDMMIVRDDSEVKHLGGLFSRVPAMASFVSTLRDRYCMNEASFTEVDYRHHLGHMLQDLPNVSAARLNLPFPLVSSHSRAATMILGNTFEALAQRPEGSEPLRTLVLENVTNKTIVSLWRNPRDVKNIIDALAQLENLVVSVRRYRDVHSSNIHFGQRLWEMIGKAPLLESLCLVGLDLAAEPSFQPIRLVTQQDCPLSVWLARSLPPVAKPPKSVLRNLTYLELRRVEVQAPGLLSMLWCFAGSLRELYLDEVYLMVMQSPVAPDDSACDLWVGMPNTRPQYSTRWIATCLRQLSLQLRICRVASLGYNHYFRGVVSASLPAYDLADPCFLNRTLEQRFVEVVLGFKQPDAPDGTPVVYLPEDEGQTWACADKERPAAGLVPGDWSAAYYPKPTSAWQKSIDCQFPNVNPYTLDQLHRFANTACEGMDLINRVAMPEMEGGRDADSEP